MAPHTSSSKAWDPDILSIGFTSTNVWHRLNLPNDKYLSISHMKGKVRLHTHTCTLHSAPNYAQKILPPVWGFYSFINLSSFTHKFSYVDWPSCSYYRGGFTLRNIKELVLISLARYPKTRIPLASKLQLDMLASCHPLHHPCRWATFVVAWSKELYIWKQVQANINWLVLHRVQDRRNSKLERSIGQEQEFGPKEFTLGSGLKGFKKMKWDQHNMYYSVLCVHFVGPRNIRMQCWEFSLNLSHPMVIFPRPHNKSTSLSNVISGASFLCQQESGISMVWELQRLSTLVRMVCNIRLESGVYPIVLNRARIAKRYIAMPSKHRHQKGMYHNEIKTRVHNIDIILGPTININRKNACNQFKEGKKEPKK